MRELTFAIVGAAALIALSVWILRGDNSAEWGVAASAPPAAADAAIAAEPPTSGQGARLSNQGNP